MNDYDYAHLDDGDSTDQKNSEVLADDPGPWFIAHHNSVCSRGGEPIHRGDTIRTDGGGDYECRDCVKANTDVAAGAGAPDFGYWSAGDY
jgi:hypothetical protein